MVAGFRRVLSSPTVVASADTIKHLFERVSTLSEPRCRTRTCVRSNDCTSTGTGGRDDNTDDPAESANHRAGRPDHAGDPYCKRCARAIPGRTKGGAVRSLVRARSGWFTAHGPRQGSGGTGLAGAGRRCRGVSPAASCMVSGKGWTVPPSPVPFPRCLPTPASSRVAHRPPAGLSPDDRSPPHRHDQTPVRTCLDFVRPPV